MKRVARFAVKEIAGDVKDGSIIYFRKKLYAVTIAGGMDQQLTL